jgi:pyruvate dehydrogenase E1 component alpha subunit
MSTNTAERTLETTLPSTHLPTDSASDTPVEYSHEQLMWWYDQMLMMRRFEERAGMLYGQQKIKGFCHLYIGQEAVAAGIESAMRTDDYIITAYRDHAAALARGITPEAVMAELYGKATGCTKGKGGSMHMFDASKHMYGGHGIVGAQIGLGAGMAFSSKYLKQNRVCVTIFGDGAARQGMLHETFNLAMLWNLPVVFIVENNLYAMGTSVERSSNVKEIYKLGQAYEMPSEPVDGMNVMAVHEAVSEAIEAAREGHGPTFLEIRTYRFRGHSMSDPMKYRTKDELNEFKEEDPILKLKHHLLEQNVVTIEKLDDLDAEIALRVDAAVEHAENAPWPDASELYTDVYTEPYPFLMD